MSIGDSKGAHPPPPDMPGRQDPAHSSEQGRDVDLVGENIIDLRPYLIREIADARTPPDGGLTGDDRPEEARADLEAAQRYLREMFEAGAALPVSERLPDLIKRLRADRLAAFGLSDDDEF